MTRKNRKVVTTHLDLLQMPHVIGPGRSVLPLKALGFRPLYLPAGSLCLIERPYRGGMPYRILVLNCSIPPFLQSRHFLKLNRLFWEATKAGKATAWMAFFPGRKSPKYVTLPIPPPLAAMARSSVFVGRGKRGRRKKVDYQAIHNYRLLHPKLSHQGIARRLRLPRSTVSRILGTEDLSE